MRLGEITEIISIFLFSHVPLNGMKNMTLQSFIYSLTRLKMPCQNFPYEILLLM